MARLADERSRLEAEVGELRAELEGVRARRAGAGRTRRVAAAVLVVMTVIVFTVAVLGVWARRNALNTDRWVQTVGPLANEPAVQEALGRWITTELIGVLDPEEFFESVLPERGQILAAPLTAALRGFVDDKVSAFLASDTFERLWLAVNERAHARVVAVLEGDTGNLQIVGDNVVINLVPVLNQILAEIGDASPEILGRTVDLPTITVDELPAEAVEKLGNALGRDLPENFGQFTVFEAGRLEEVQDAVALFDRLVIAAVVVAIGLFALALWLSPRRRRTLLQLTIGIVLSVVLIRRLGIRLESDVVDLAKPENREAVGVIVGAFVSSLLNATAWILGIAAVVIVIAVLTGPYHWAEVLRHRVGELAPRLAGTVRATVTRRPDDPAAVWVAAHREMLQAGGVGVGILVLLTADLSWLGLLLLLLVVAAFALGVQRIAEGAGAGEEAG